MFNRKLKQRLAELEDALASKRQIRDSLYNEMLVLEFSVDGEIRFANNNMLQTLGYQQDQILSRRIEELIPQSFRSHENYPIFSHVCAHQNTGPAPYACSAATAKKLGYARSCSRFMTASSNSNISPCAVTT